MTILAIIQNPKDEYESMFSIPVATERAFSDLWEPTVEELKLVWLPLFSTGVEVTCSDSDSVLAELKTFNSFYEKKYGRDDVYARVIMLIEYLNSVFKRKDAVVYIG